MVHEYPTLIIICSSHEVPYEEMNSLGTHVLVLSGTYHVELHNVIT